MKGPIANAPRTGKQVLVGGPSGYKVPYDQHWETAHWQTFTFDPQTGERGRWVTDEGSAYTDSWPDPIWYRELPHD